MALTEMIDALRQGRERGACGAWFGGGEPTLHGDLPRAIVAARRLGYRTVRLQTNGLRLAYPDYARQLVDLGLNQVSLLAMGHDAAAHDAVTRVPGSFELMNRAALNLAGLEVAPEADLLISQGNLDRLSETVELLAEIGVTAVTFWLLSLHGLDRESLSAWLPPVSRVVPALQAAFDRADALAMAASTLHLPPCALGKGYHDRYRHAGLWNLLVFAPGRAPFRAERSPMEGGVFLEGCARCTHRKRCLGLRADYLEVHGPAGFEPILS